MTLEKLSSPFSEPLVPFATTEVISVSSGVAKRSRPDARQKWGNCRICAPFAPLFLSADIIFFYLLKRSRRVIAMCIFCWNGSRERCQHRLRCNIKAFEIKYRAYMRYLLSILFLPLHKISSLFLTKYVIEIAETYLSQEKHNSKMSFWNCKNIYRLL